MNEELPGVRLWLKQYKLQSAGTVTTAEVVMRCEVNDANVWESVKEKLREGLRIYSVDDFKTELLNALRDEVKTLETRLSNREQEIRELRHQNKVLRAAVAVTAVGNEDEQEVGYKHER